MSKTIIIFTIYMLGFMNMKADDLMTDYVKLSQDILFGVKTDKDVAPLIRSLEKADNIALAKALDTDDKRYAFWLNMYNALVQMRLSADTSLYKSRSSFYGSTSIMIAGKKLSLDNIEHGILRHSQFKYGLGYITKCCPSSFEKQYRVHVRDKRIHFALNCGAESCPPIAFYAPDKISTQLDLATENYLRQTCKYDPTSNIVHVTVLFSWFKGDFKGTKGIVETLRHYNVIPAVAKVKIVYDRYDWTMKLKNYTK